MIKMMIKITLNDDVKKSPIHITITSRKLFGKSLITAFKAKKE